MKSDSNPKMGGTEWVLLIVLSVLWGGSFFFAKLGVAELPPLLMVFLRVGLASIALGAVLIVLRQSMPTDWRTWRALFGMGLVNNVIPFALFFWSQTHISSGLAAILNATTPLFGVVIAQLAGAQERLTAARMTGIALGIAGVAIMLAPGLVNGLDGDMLAECACLAAAFSYGVAGVFGRRFLNRLPPLVTASGQLMASTVIMTPVIVLAVPDPWLLRPSQGAIAAVIGLALISTALAYVIYFRILTRAGSTNILLVTLLIPVSAALLGGLFLGEELAARHVAGMMVIALGLACIDGRPVTFLRRAFP